MTVSDFAALQDFLNDHTEQGSFDDEEPFIKCQYCDHEFTGPESIQAVLEHLVQHGIYKP
jgi:hypothetical protein